MKLYICAAFAICCLHSTAQTYFQNYFGLPDTFLRHQSFAVAGNNYFHIYQQTQTDDKISKMDANGNILFTKGIYYPAGALNAELATGDGNDVLFACMAYNAGYRNVFLKTDSLLNPIWATEINLGDINVPTRILKTGNGYYYSGYRDYPTGIGYTLDITLAKFDNSGNMLWANAYGDNTYGYSNEASAVTPDGGIVTAGEKALQFQTETNADLVVARFDASGVQSWVKTIDVATFFDDFDVAGVIVLPDTSVIVAGAPFNSNGNTDLVLVKLNAVGNIVWAKRYFNIGYHETAQSMLYDSQGNITILGIYKSTTVSTDNGYFLFKADSAGTILVNTAMDVPSNDLYSANGMGLLMMEDPGTGYAMNGYYAELSSFPFNWHPIIYKTNYNGVTLCNVIDNTFPFTTASLSWTSLSNGALSVDAGITSSAATVSFNNSSIAGSNDLCSVLGISGPGKMNAFGLYPNPAGNEVTIEFNAPKTGNVQIKISDLEGRNVYTLDVKINYSDEPVLRLNVSSIKEGIYFITLETSSSLMTQKFIKQ